jgi:hypothetical protein
MKPILCLDFDGVCHSYTSGWKGANVIPDPPVPELFDFLVEASKEFQIAIFSSRSNQSGGIDAMKEWFVAWYVDWIQSQPITELPAYSMTRAEATPIVTAMLHFPTEKPPAFVGIDDRVLTFDGTWPSLTSLQNFKPWNKKEV